MQSFVVVLLVGLANARLSDDKCKEYNKKSLSSGASLINDFPHMGLLGYIYDETPNYNCPATLIDVSIAITPAHCIRSLVGEPKSALFGTMNPNKKGDNYKSVDIVEMIVHPQFDYRSKNNNIALVKFSPPITPNDYIRPGCLYSKNVEDDQVLVDLIWGRTAEDEGFFKINSSIVSASSCKKTYKKKVTIDTESLLCMNRNFPSNYRIHNGGTSHVYEDGLPKIAAIDNYGPTMGTSEIPDVNTKIYTYLDWIEQNAWGKDKVK